MSKRFVLVNSLFRRALRRMTGNVLYSRKYEERLFSADYDSSELIEISHWNGTGKFVLNNDPLSGRRFNQLLTPVYKRKGK